MSTELISKENQLPTDQMPGTVYNRIVPSQANNIYHDTAMMNTIYSTARILSNSNVLPKEYQKNEGNCFIACELAARTGLSTLMVAQSLAIVYGRPTWSGQACTALINQSRRYDKPLKIRFVDKNGNDMPRYIQGTTHGAYAYATQGAEEFCGTCVTWDMANAEGWVEKNGSKWKSMPELMFKYRAASFFAREHCPDLLFGCSVEGEAEDIASNTPAAKAQSDMETARRILESVGETVGKADTDA